MNTTFGVIISNRSFFPDHLVLTARKKLLASLEAWGYNAVILSDNAFGNMRADDSDKADDAEERNTHRRDQRGQQHGDKAQPVHVHAHAPGGRVAAEKRVAAPA